MTYGELNLFFLVIAGITAWVLKRPNNCMISSNVVITMVAMTAVFDNLIVWSGIVAYNLPLLQGIYVGVVPIEDFAYTVVAVLLIPAIWKAVTKE